MQKGKIIYLEGVSSSGKTTLAKILQARLAKPFVYFSYDMFLNMMPENFGEIDINAIVPKINSAVHPTIKLFSDLGIDVIFDTIPAGEFAKPLCESPVLYVSVTCPLEELRRREKKRSDRQIGLSESQLANMASQEEYDITVDTYANSSEECADKIIELLDSPEKFTAFKKLWLQRTN